MEYPNKHIRDTRAVDVCHGEAFQVMLYSTDNGKQVWIWNSRDGVTPFGVTIDGVDYRHAMRRYAPDYTAVLPERASHVFVSYTREAWAVMVARRYEFGKPRGIEAQFPTFEQFSQIVPFEHGSPRRLTRAEYLAETIEFAGRPD